MLLRQIIVLTAALGSSALFAQDVRYVSDTQYIPLRRGAGSDYRIVHRGIPSGTRLTVSETSSDGVWSLITTDRGTSGWMRSQYLMEKLPAALKVNAAEKQAENLAGTNNQLEGQLREMLDKNSSLSSQLNDSSQELTQVTEEFNQLKQISGKAVQLDTENRRLAEEVQNMRSEVEMLEAENQRLEDKLTSEAFMNGALAVLLGVIITLVVPRLWPKRRRSSSWA
ncbi:MAG: TIGR04211 family SH3 domain-containing protein [Pseudomonadota bacterium]